MEQTEVKRVPPPHVFRSLAAVIVGSLVLRAAGGAMGENIQFYFNAIHAAALSSTHPLRQIVAASDLQEISYTVGGIILGAYFASELLGAMVLGAWSDRFGRKLFILLGPLLGAVAVLITSVTTVIWLLVVTRLLEGLATASNAPATLGYIAETTADSPKLRVRISGLFEVATIGGAALGFWLGGWLWHEYGTAARIFGIPFTSPAFAINSLIYLASLAILWVGIQEIREKSHISVRQAVSPIETLKEYWALARNPLIASFAPAWIAINAVLGIWTNHSARILTDKIDAGGQLLVGRFNALQAGNIVAVYAGFFILGIVIWSVFFPGIKKTTAMLIGSGGLVASCILISAINHQRSTDSPFTLILAALLVISILVQSAFTPAALAYLADITETQTSSRGAIMGLYSVFLGLGQVIGLSGGGVFIDISGADGMALATGLLGLCAGIFVVRLRGSEAELQSPSNASH